jgi:hypothetical protein
LEKNDRTSFLCIAALCPDDYKLTQKDIYENMKIAASIKASEVKVKNKNKNIALKIII